MTYVTPEPAFHTSAKARGMSTDNRAIGHTAYHVPCRYLLVHTHGRVYIVANELRNLASAFSVSCAAVASFDDVDMLAAFVAYDMLQLST